MFRLTAHAGPDNTPANQLPSLLWAETHRPDVFELDVQRYKNKLVLSHDVPEKMPEVTFAAALQRLHPLTGARTGEPVGVNCDLKVGGLVDPVVSALINHDMAERAVLTGTVPLIDWEACRARHAHKPLPEVYLNPEVLLPTFYLRLRQAKIAKSTILGQLQLTRLQRLGIRVLNLNAEVVDEELLSWCEAVGLQVSLWTVNDAAAVRCLAQKYPLICSVTTCNWSEAAALLQDGAPGSVS